MSDFSALRLVIPFESRFFIFQKFVRMWDMIEELEINSSNLAKQRHVKKLSQEILMHKAQLGNITEALPVIQKRVHGIDQKIQKLSSTLPVGNLI